MSNRTTKLDGVHPKLVQNIVAIHRQMLDQTGRMMIVTDGVRTAQEQHLLWLQGRDPGHPGHIVTHCDGITIKSNHQVKDDGFGHAVDCCFIIDGRASWDELLPWGKYGELARSYGLVWGGDWSVGKRDKPHVELVHA